MKGFKMIAAAELVAARQDAFRRETLGLEEEVPAWEGKDEDGGVGSDRRGIGPEALLYTVIEQAQIDCRMLQGRNVIVDGDCVAEWPQDAHGKPLVLSHEYDGTCPVKELLYFMRGGDHGMAWLLEYLGSRLIDPEKVLAELGLVKGLKLVNGKPAKDGKGRAA